MKKRKLIMSALAIVLLYGNAQAQTWSPLNSGITDYIKEIDFVNENTGWCLYSDSLLLKTTDGGYSWINQEIGVDRWMWDIEFVNEDIGYSIGVYGGVWKTTDGGDSWSIVSTPVNWFGIQNWLFSINAISADTLLVGCDLGHVQKSTDGGNTWDIVLNDDLGWFYDIEFIDDQVGYALNENKIFKTIDGGNNWTEIVYLQSAGFNRFSFLDENNGVITGQGIDKVLYTNDGFQTLNPSNISIPPGVLPLDPYIVSSDEVWMGLNDATVYKSIDLGQTWTLEMTNTSFTDYSFVNQNLGFSSGLNGQIHKYSNTVSVNETIDVTSAIIYPNPSNGFFTIDLGQRYENVTIKINDLTGITLFNKNYSNVDNLKLDFIKKSGLYFVNIETEGMTKTNKLLIN